MRCVLYLRMSTDYQESSIGDQRAALIEHAQKCKYKVVGEYVDEGISGDATEKRFAFQKMIRDCGSKSFDAVLAWDQDRFGRFDPLEAGFWIKPMRDAGVVLETIAQGRIDWNDFAGRLVWSVTQEAKHSYLRDLAGNCLRGTIARSKAGISTGRIPYGYQRNADGKYEFGDPGEVDTVRMIFNLRLSGLGYWLIAAKLNELAIPAPGRGDKWGKQAVRDILTREAYAGTLVFGKYHSGKYRSLTDGIVGPAKTRSINSTPIRVENAHPAIIARDIWDKVQRSLGSPKPHARATSGGAPLAGLLVCSRCEMPMYSMSLRVRDGRIRQHATYKCSTYHTGKGCGCCAVRQDVIHGLVSERVRQGILGSALTVKELEQAIRKKMPAARKQDAGDLKSRIAELDRQIDTATARILTVDQSLVKSLEAKLLQMHEKRAAIAQQIGEISLAKEYDPSVIAEDLWKLINLLESKDSALIRSALASMFSKIVVDFAPVNDDRYGRRFVMTDFHLIDILSSKEWPNVVVTIPFWRPNHGLHDVIHGPTALRTKLS